MEIFPYPNPPIPRLDSSSTIAVPTDIIRPSTILCASVSLNVVYKSVCYPLHLCFMEDLDI